MINMAKSVNIIDLTPFRGSSPPPPAPAPAPAPAPVLTRRERRDSLGRKITELRLEALKSGQFKPGTNGFRGGNRKRQREHALAYVTHLLKVGKLKPSDSIATFMNLIFEADARSIFSQRVPKGILRETADADVLALLGKGADDLLRDSGIGGKKKARR